MRFSPFVPAILLLCSCSRSDGVRAGQTSDSSTVTELSPPGASVLSAQRPVVGSSATSGGFGPGDGDTLTTVDAGPRPPSGPVAADSPTIVSNFRCGIAGTPVLTSLGVGNLQIGRTLAVVKQTCRVRRDLQEQNEGMPERVLTVLVADEPVRVTVVSGLVWRISLSTPRFATTDGLRVGTALTRMVKHGGAHFSEGEDGLYATLESHCGLNFRFSIPSRETPGKPWGVPHLVQRHGRATVDRILVTRCAG